MVSDVGLLILRLAFAGSMVLNHGLAKLLNFSEMATKFPSFMGIGQTGSLCLAIFAEVVCATFVVLGAATRLACIPLIITMLVAFFMIHAGQPFGQRELAFCYAVPFVVIALTGGGRLSLDSFFGWFRKGA